MHRVKLGAPSTLNQIGFYYGCWSTLISPKYRLPSPYSLRSLSPAPQWSLSPQNKNILFWLLSLSLTPCPLKAITLFPCDYHPCLARDSCYLKLHRAINECVARSQPTFYDRHCRIASPPRRHTVVTVKFHSNHLYH